MSSNWSLSLRFPHQNLSLSSSSCCTDRFSTIHTLIRISYSQVYGIVQFLKTLFLCGAWFIMKTYVPWIFYTFCFDNMTRHIYLVQNLVMFPFSWPFLICIRCNFCLLSVQSSHTNLLTELCEVWPYCYLPLMLPAFCSPSLVVIRGHSCTLIVLVCTR